MGECLEVGVIQGGVGTPHGVQDVGAGGGVSRGGSDPGWSWDSCTRSPRCRSRWESSWMGGSNPCLSRSVKKMINMAKRKTFPASSYPKESVSRSATEAILNEVFKKTWPNAKRLRQDQKDVRVFLPCNVPSPNAIILLPEADRRRGYF